MVQVHPNIILSVTSEMEPAFCTLYSLIYSTLILKERGRYLLVMMVELHSRNEIVCSDQV